jgi:hypothetical protein
MSRAIRLPNTHEEPQGALANDSRKRAKRPALTGVEKIANALRDIERDVESNNGLYPLNGGRITQQEVLRRAALSPAFLEKSRNKKVKAHVTQWLHGVNGQILRGAKTIRRTITARVSEVTDEVKAIRQVWAEAELEYVHARQMVLEIKVTNAALEKANAALKNEVAKLKAQLAGKNIVPLRRSER